MTGRPPATTPSRNDPGRPASAARSSVKSPGFWLRPRSWRSEIDVSNWAVLIHTSREGFIALDSLRSQWDAIPPWGPKEIRSVGADRPDNPQAAALLDPETRPSELKIEPSGCEFAGVIALSATRPPLREA
jgi:hypothetical protein